LACTGGPGVVKGVQRRLCELGAETQSPLDDPDKILAAAYRVMDRALEEQGARILAFALNGELRAELEALVAGLRSEDPSPARLRLAELERETSLAIDLLEPPKVVILGRPNAGKSTLFNALLGHERAIVSEQEGTTRDTIDDIAIIAGRPFRLMDTAGLRISTDIIESAGMKMGLSARSEARLALYLVDSQRFLEAGPAAPLSELLGVDPGPWPALRLLSKSDKLSPGERERLAERGPGELDWLLISASTGEGLDSLGAELRRRLAPNAPDCVQRPALFTAEHLALLEQAQAQANSARAAQLLWDALLKRAAD
jgi:tRNA modification GTPase